MQRYIHTLTLGSRADGPGVKAKRFFDDKTPSPAATPLTSPRRVWLQADEKNGRAITLPFGYSIKLTSLTELKLQFGIEVVVVEVLIDVHFDELDDFCV